MIIEITRRREKVFKESICVEISSNKVLHFSLVSSWGARVKMNDGWEKFFEAYVIAIVATVVSVTTNWNISTLLSFFWFDSVLSRNASHYQLVFVLRSVVLLTT